MTGLTPVKVPEGCINAVPTLLGEGGKIKKDVEVEHRSTGAIHILGVINLERGRRSPTVVTLCEFAKALPIDVIS